MSAHFKIDVSTINLKLKLGNKVSKIIWYITKTGKYHISSLATINTNYTSFFEDILQKLTQFFSK